jgi:hypothetical protein
MMIFQQDDWLPVKLAKMNGMTAVVARIGLQIEVLSYIINVQLLT